MKAIVKEREASLGKRIPIVIRRWGREGESDYCLETGALSEGEERALVETLKSDVSAQAPTVRVGRTPACRAQPSPR